MAAELYNEDCIKGAARIDSNSIDLGIYDPDFGIGGSSFSTLYNRKTSKIIGGYFEAPQDYQSFSNQWIAQATRILKPNGTIYIVSGWTNLRAILNSVEESGLVTLNHIIWKYNFGVYTTRKFCSSHYHILRLGKSKKVKFNRTCRYTPEEKNESGGSLLYQDMEDVWYIKKEYSRGTLKNCNKLPDELVDKMILYSSDPGDLVCDFFLGNGTTAKRALALRRNIVGFEINPVAFRHILRSLPVDQVAV